MVFRRGERFAPPPGQVLALFPKSLAHHLLHFRAGAVLNLLKPSPTSSIAIFGIGAVGIGALFASAYLGIKTIIVVDIVPSRLELARSLGATHCVNGKDKDVVKQIKALTAYNSGTNYGIEATGNVHVLKTAYAALANLGHLVR